MLWTDLMGKVYRIPFKVFCLTLLSMVSASFVIASENPTPPVLVCDDQINVSLNGNCDAVITVAMILEGESAIPGFDPSHYDIDIEGLPSNIISKVGIYTVTVTEKNPPFKPPLNSCWGHILVEDKLPPRMDPESCDCPPPASDPSLDNPD
ncbi:MAG: hypothetical protein HKN67_06035, partial [Saprospiraceae bacterium]|nr:hypothetical protein [Saprospiraceae bacterium]